MGRPSGIASQIAAETGLSIRTVQRVLANRIADAETLEEKKLRRFLDAFRGFASFCRENDPDVIGQLLVNDEQAGRLREYNTAVGAFLTRLNNPAE